LGGGGGGGFFLAAARPLRVRREADAEGEMETEELEARGLK
jgi:hypothetical protein